MKHFLLFFCLVTAPIWAQQTKTIHVLVALCDNKYKALYQYPKELAMGKMPIATSIGVVVMACALILNAVRNGSS